MKKLISVIGSYIYRLWVFLVFTVFMIILLPGLTIPFLFGTRLSFVGYFFLWLWSWIFSLLTFIRYDFEGREHFKKGTAYIYVCNHTSFLDIPGLCLLLPGEFRPLAKKELKRIPIFGIIAQGASVIVDRSSSESKRNSIDQLKKTLAKGISILIFPEGTQNRSNKILQPFKDGAFRIAIDSQKSVLPIAIQGASKLMPPGTINLRPGRISMRVGTPITTEQLSYKDIAQLKEATYQSMLSLLTSES